MEFPIKYIICFLCNIPLLHATIPKTILLIQIILGLRLLDYKYVLRTTLPILLAFAPMQSPAHVIDFYRIRKL